MRCLTLADALRLRGLKSKFICRLHQGHLLDLIYQRGFEVIPLPAEGNHTQTSAEPTHAAWLGAHWATDAEQTRAALWPHPADCLVMDHYGLDSRWERAIKPTAHSLMVIDDLADRPHDCHLLLDQNLGRTEHNYHGLVGPDTRLLVGPNYALLRPEFRELRAFSLQRRSHNLRIERLLISLGGVDRSNITGQVLETIKTCILPPNLRITVVMGPHAPWLKQVRRQAEQMTIPTEVLVGVDNMGQLMANSDLAIGAAGSTSWERCCLGLPTILLVIADNQKSIADSLRENGAALVLDVTQLQHTLGNALSQIVNKNSIKDMIYCASTITDGSGSARVAEIIAKGLQ